MDWLRTRVWPMEAAHTPAIAARGGAARRPPSCSRSGTTAVLTMETVHDTDVVFEAVGRERPARDDRQVHDGLRRRGAGAAAGGDARVDRRERRAPQALGRRRATAACTPRSRRASPSRARASCSRRSPSLSAQHHALVHTHASESRDEIAIVQQRTGGADEHRVPREPCSSRRRVCARAHCVWVDDREQQLLAEHDVKVMHCPGSNLKLGSGIAPVPEMRARGITVSLGADGAACNNRLDMFEEMRLAAVLQAMRKAARRAAGARRRCGWRRAPARGRSASSDEIGSLEAGKRADVIVVDRDRPHLAPGPGPVLDARLRRPRQRRPDDDRRRRGAGATSSRPVAGRPGARSRARGARAAARASSPRAARSCIMV